MSGTKPKYTPTQKRMLKLLSDGLPHSRQELHGCLWDEAGDINNIRTHIYALRKHIRPKGLYIVCEVHIRKIHYRLVRLVIKKAGS